MEVKLENTKIIVTGCGFKPINHVYKFNEKATHNIIPIDDVENKMNIGTAVAFNLLKRNIEVILVSRTQEKLKKIKRGLIQLGCKEDLISYISSDITTNTGVNNLVKKLPSKKTFYWVQSIGMGGGSYKISNDNIYLPFEKISPELIAAEQNIVPATHRLLLKLLPLFRKQIKSGAKAKICIITSMSGERGYHYGATHVAAKHALVGYIKGIKRELKDERIDIYDIRPGGIDTGMYDNPHVRKAVEEISEKTKMWNGKKPIFASPLEVAKKVYSALFEERGNDVYRILAKHQK